MADTAYPKGELLRLLARLELTSVAELAAITCRSESTVRRWMRGDAVPDVVDLHRALTGLKSDEARRRIVHRIFNHLPITVEWLDSPTAEADNEFDHAADAMYHIARLVQRMQKLRKQDRSPDRTAQLEIEHIVAQAIDELVRVKVLIAEQGHSRRRAKVSAR